MAQCRRTRQRSKAIRSGPPRLEQDGWERGREDPGFALLSVLTHTPVVLSTARGCSHPLASCGILPICRRMTLKVVLHGVLPRKPFHGGGRREALLLRVHVSFFFFSFFFSARHPAGIDMCPAAGAQTLVMVLMLPWQPCHSGPALHCRVPFSLCEQLFSKSQMHIFRVVECHSCDLLSKELRLSVCGGVVWVRLLVFVQSVCCGTETRGAQTEVYIKNFGHSHATSESRCKRFATRTPGETTRLSIQRHVNTSFGFAGLCVVASTRRLGSIAATLAASSTLSQVKAFCLFN